MKKLLIVCVVLLLSPYIALAQLLPDTGQKKCYDESGSEILPCPLLGQDFYGQDASYAPCNPHYYTDLGSGIVRDNVTRLEWQKDTAPGTYTWQQAEDYCNNLVLGGHSDWRLPTVKELSILVDSSVVRPGPVIDPTFSNTVSSFYWSSTTKANLPDNAWNVSFITGGVAYISKSMGYYVRAVRGEQLPNNFKDNGDGTITDSSTGLMWQMDGSTTRQWKEALSYCENLTLADYNDWRLPNRNELQSIVDYTRYNPTIDPIFANTESSRYWSSTTDASYPDATQFVHFSNGDIGYIDKLFGYYVRAVRGGQCGSFVPTTTTTSICPTQEIYGEYSEETELSRYFRDDILSKTSEGRELITLYYKWSPIIIKVIQEDEEFKQEVKVLLDEILTIIEEIAE
jgi:hypothetical protein